MNWPKIWLKYQRYESFHSCLGARKKNVGPNFPIFSKFGGAKKKSKGNEGTNKKKKKKIDL